MRHLLWTLLAVVLPLSASAVTIEFPEEELAKESVLPVFDGGTVAVKSRRVVTKKHFEIGPVFGMIFNEPFFSPYMGGLYLGYHFNEFSSLQITGLMRDSKLSSDAKEIDSKPGTYYGFQHMPIPKYILLADYQLTPYYGKISITKDTVFNMNLYGLLGAGVTDLGGQVSWIADVGFGQNLFFTPRIGLRTDFRVFLYQGPNVLSRYTTTHADTSGTVYKPTFFDKQFNVSPSVTLGLIFIL